MLRNTFLAFLIVLAAAATSHATTTAGADADGKASIGYDSATGAFSIRPDGQPVGLIQILSASSIFNATNATFPTAGLFTANSAMEKGWADLPTGAVSTNFNLGNIAAPGLTSAFLLNDLTIELSGGFGTDPLPGNLVYLGDIEPPLVPVITTVAVGEYESVATIVRQLTASNGPNTWSALTPTTGTPALAATLSAQGEFSWNPAGSRRGPKGNGVAYSWTATATNAAGADTDVAISLTLIPEPATVSLFGLAMVALVGLFRRR
jgi:hypothetical protein